MAIRAVFFDLGGTLLIMRRHRIFSRILTESGYPVTPDQVQSAYYKTEPSWLAAYGGRAMNGQESEEAYRQLDAMIFRHLFPGRTDDEVERVSVIMRQMWPQVERTIPLELYPDALPTLKRLRADRYTLGLVSNAPPDTIKVIDSLGLPKYIPIIVVSGIVGISKPSPEIFHIALRAAGTEPAEAIHVGDLYEADVVGARNAGLQGVLIDREGNHASSDCPKIAGLGEVYRFLE